MTGSLRLVAGVLVLGAILAAMLFVRANGGLEAGSPATGAEPVAVPVTDGDASTIVGGTRMWLSVRPWPPVAMQPTAFSLRVDAPDGSVRSVSSARLALRMEMPMGVPVQTLTAQPDGTLGATVTMPFCTAGSRWDATVDAIVGGQVLAARFFFDAVRPRERAR